MRIGRRERHTLAGAYAMDAVTAADRTRFERHLARCPACALELRELREATAQLALAVAVEPPAIVIGQTLAAAAQARQLPPDAGQGSQWPVWRARDTAVPGRGWRLLLPRLSLALAAGLLALGAASSVVAVRAEHQLGQAGLREEAIAQVLTAPDAVMLTARVRVGGTATVVMSQQDRSLVFTTAGLPSLAGGRCYQLWLMGPRGDRSVGMLPAAHAGMTSPVVASGLVPGDWVGLTVEPEGGSPQPTTRPVLMLSLAA
jgi:anti-sigma-K factor RskA